MDAKAAHESIQNALRQELSKHWGQIAAIEAKVDRSEGYLRKFCRGNRSISLNLLLESLEALNVEPGVFFAKALPAACDSDSFLRDLEQPGKEVPLLTKIAKATLRIEAEIACDPTKTSAVILPQSGADRQAETLVTKVKACSGKEQKRRLRTARRYRTLEFALAYLDYLDKHRYEDTKAALRLVETVALDLVPQIPCCPSQRLAVQCLAVALYGDTHRMMGSYATASHAIRLALETARRLASPQTIAVVLKRGAYLLADHGHFEQALILLRERFEVYFDLGLEVEMAKTLIDRGFMLSSAGRVQESLQVLFRALEMLPPLTSRLRGYYLATYSALAHGYEQLEDFGNADNWLKEAIATFETEDSIPRAKLIWHQGRVAYAKQDYRSAVEYLETALEILDEHSSSAMPLARLDLTRALLANGEPQAAVNQALKMAALLKGLRKNKLMEAAIAEYTRLALEGKLTIAAIDHLQPKLEQRRA